jgi:hypothetical protein
MSNQPQTAVKPKRRWTTFSLRTFLLLTLALSVTLGLFGRAWLKAYRDSQPPTLRELAQIAKRHGVPMPPPGAKLVLIKTGERHARGALEHAIYSTAFKLREQPNRQIAALWGCDELRTPNTGAVPEAPSWREFSLDAVQEMRAGYEVDWSSGRTLLTAVQAAYRGDDALADAIHQRWREELTRLGTLHPDRAEQPLDLRQRIRDMAYRRIELALWESKPHEWRDIRDQLSRLLEESESLRRDRAQLLADLSATVDARPAPPGSVEALLLAWARSAGDDRAAWEAIVTKGFDAVPDLIQLCEDRRYADRVFPHDDPRYKLLMAGEIESVGDAADALLMEISGFRYSRILSVDMPDEESSHDVEFWTRWWKQARSQGERAYCICNAFPLLPGQTEIREGLAAILVHKHADALPTLDEELPRLCHAAVARESIAASVLKLELPNADRAAILTGFFNRGTLADKRAILNLLMLVDRERCIEMLRTLLDNLPTDVTEFDDDSPNRSIATLVLRLNDPLLTETCLRAARRNVNLRMELLSRLAYWSRGYDLELRAALLAAFLDDDTPRDRSLKSEESLSDDFRGITVRNFAAMHIAKLLKMDVQPNQDWTSAQWSALREQVRERLKGEELPELE